MPTYEYACTECGHRFEEVQSFTDEPITTCPECGSPLRKVFGAVGIVLKGSGFYKNDSRAAANGRAGSRPADGDGAPKEAASSDTKAGAEKSGSEKGPASGSTGDGGSGKNGGTGGGSSSGSTPAPSGSSSTAS